MKLRELALKRLKIFAIGDSNITRQVCNLFQAHVEQPLLGFRIAEKKTDRLNIFTKLTPNMDSLIQKTMEESPNSIIEINTEKV